MKKRACNEVGIESFGKDLPGDVSEEELLKVISELNDNPHVDGNSALSDWGVLALKLM